MFGDILILMNISFFCAALGYQCQICMDKWQDSALTLLMLSKLLAKREKLYLTY